jgi:hypothetical protein
LLRSEGKAAEADKRTLAKLQKSLIGVSVPRVAIQAMEADIPQIDTRMAATSRHLGRARAAPRCHQGRSFGTSQPAVRLEFPPSSVGVYLALSFFSGYMAPSWA